MRVRRKKTVKKNRPKVRAQAEERTGELETERGEEGGGRGEEGGGVIEFWRG